MYREHLKRAFRPIVRPLLHQLEARLRLQVESSVASIHEQMAALQQQVASLRTETWHAKAVPVGDEILVGCRHLGLLYLVKANDTLLGPKFIIDGECEPDTTAFLMRTVE